LEKLVTEEGPKHKEFVAKFAPLCNKLLVKPMEVQVCTDRTLSVVLWGLLSCHHRFVQIKDLRSEIVRQSATTISAVARALGIEFKKAAVTLLKTLVDCAAQTNKVMRGTK
jgi:hypothetical protein